MQDRCKLSLNYEDSYILQDCNFSDEFELFEVQMQTDKELKIIVAPTEIAEHGVAARHKEDTYSISKSENRGAQRFQSS